MSLEENKAIARRYNEEIWSKGNLSVIEALISPDFYQHGVPEMRTPAGVSQSATNFHNTNSDIHITVEDQIAEGDKVMNRLSAHGIDIATGQKWTVAIMFDVFRIVDGKIVELWQARS